MDVASAQAAAAAGGGGGGGPAPFLLKTYDMVDDTSTDEIVSWSSNRNSFVVWNPPEFARLLLPMYFKHNNFSSFIRQLNTYGFRKIDPERWEFANEDFIKDQKPLLKNIHRRKPIHSHSNPAGSAIDPERAAFEEEIEKLSREKTALEATLLKFKQEQSAAKVELEDLNSRVGGMEQRQENLLTFLEKAVRNPDFVEQIARKLESMDFLAYNKKRRVPHIDSSQLIAENSFVDNHSSSRPDFGNIFHQDFSNKLRLELSPAVSDIHLVSCSTESSNEDAGSPRRLLSQGCPKDSHVRTGGLTYAPETIELSDTGTSFSLKRDSSLSNKAGASEGPKLHSFEPNLNSNEDGDCHVSCQLNLTLASSPLQVRANQCSARMPEFDHEIAKSPESRSNTNYNEADFIVSSVNRTFSDADAAVPTSKDAYGNNQVPQTAPARVNDVFWEQFLTERPGSSDTEETSSTFRASPYPEQEERRSSHEMSANEKSIERLTLS